MFSLVTGVRATSSAVRSTATVASVTGGAAQAVVRTLSTTTPAGAAIPVQQPDMLCMQCEQTEHGTGCTTVGVCSKDPEVAALQDLLVHSTKNIAQYSTAADQLGAPRNVDVDQFTASALFSTVTNVQFDPARMTDYLATSKAMEAAAKASYEAAGGTETFESGWEFTDDVDDLVRQAKPLGVWQRMEDYGEDVGGLMELITYGIKGMAAYAAHAKELGAESPQVYAEMHKILSDLAAPEQSVDGLLANALATGKTNLDVLAMLDGAHTSSFGAPTPTEVRTTPKRATKAIAISGHDMADLKALLEQTEGTGIDIYTHGEMLPGHGYPELRKYDHLAGHYGTAWQMQNFDFSTFPGPVIVTTNCITAPKERYSHRLYTTNDVGWPGIPHIKDRDFSGVIAQALECEGFAESDLVDDPVALPVGYGHGAVLGMAGDLLDLINEGKLTHFFFVGGCDGTEGERSYFRKIAKNSPETSLVLTAGCGKYRFNKLMRKATLGDTGLPRVIDMGQCNDAYGAVKVALGLADALNTDVNSLPLSFAVSWFEQKAVAVLLTLLHLNVKGIHLGPNMPAFCSPAVYDVLNKTFDLNPTGDPKTDMSKFLGQ